VAEPSQLQGRKMDAATAQEPSEAWRLPVREKAGNVQRFSPACLYEALGGICGKTRLSNYQKKQSLEWRMEVAP